MQKPFLSLALLPLLMAGCSMAPAYQAPATGIANTYPQAAGAGAVADLGWQEFVLDATLRSLIEQALVQNHDLAVATANVERARALYRVQRADQVPTLSAGASASRARSNEPVAQIGNQYQVNAGVTAFELDFFGRVRNLSDAALQSYLATAAARETVRLSLVAEVVDAYLTLLANRDQLALTERTLAAQQESYDLIKQAFDRGARSQLDLRQAQTALETARADLAALRRQVALAENALTLLVGGPVTAPAERVLGGEGTLLLTNLPEGLPSDLLTRRPDIAEAEHNLRAANANIGAARAAFFPRISLTSTLGTASTALSGLFEGGSKVWSVGGDASLPIFELGRTQANLDAAKAERDAAVARYQGAVRTGFREVADGLAARATLEDQIVAQTALVDATRDTYSLSQARYERGVDSYLQVLDAQRSLYAAESSLIALRQQRLSNLVTLYKALGGGLSDRASAS